MVDSYLLQVKGISKRFPGVVALDNVDLKVERGSVHALMGENGAGKSTLMKVVAGIYQPDSGEIEFEGKKVNIADAKTALRMGISMIHQELSPVLEMTVAENVYLGKEPRNGYGMVSRKLMEQHTKELFEKWSIPVAVNAKLKELSVARQQMVEIAKAISYNSKLLIMDEPTSAISETETRHLHDMIRQLTSSGVAVIYITHKMEEVFEIADVISVFRDGKHVVTEPASKLDKNKLITLMVGRELNQLFPKFKAQIGEVVLEVKNLCRGDVVNNVSFKLRRGEILGISGLMGCGRTEILETIFGIHPADSGEIWINGRKVVISKPAQAIKAGLGLLTEDRKLSGIMGVLSVKDNMSIASLKNYSSHLMMDDKKINEVCEEQRKRLELKTPSLSQLIDNLSGGNQQKVLVSRWLLTKPSIFMIDEPTRGIDVGAKSEIHRIMSMLVQNGKAVLMVSSEMPEILGMSDRIIVINGGSVAGEVSSGDASQEKIMHLATGEDLQVVEGKHE